MINVNCGAEVFSFYLRQYQANLNLEFNINCNQSGSRKINKNISIEFVGAR